MRCFAPYIDADATVCDAEFALSVCVRYFGPLAELLGAGGSDAGILEAGGEHAGNAVGHVGLRGGE